MVALEARRGAGPGRAGVGRESRPESKKGPMLPPSMLRDTDAKRGGGTDHSHVAAVCSSSSGSARHG